MPKEISQNIRRRTEGLHQFGSSLVTTSGYLTVKHPSGFQQINGKNSKGLVDQTAFELYDLEVIQFKGSNILRKCT